MTFFTAKLRSAHPAIYWSILSGMAALIYQVVLQKVFSYVLGYALLSTTIVVAAYMLGLALGGFLVGLFCDRFSVRAALAFYSCIEAGIGVCALGSLVGYKHYLSALPRLAENPAFLHLMSMAAFRSVLAIAALLPMTIFMGATLPVLILGVNASTARDPGSSISVTSIYSANLLGGLAGVLISAYLVLPYLGLWGAAILACCANFSIAVVVLRFRSSAPLVPAAKTQFVAPEQRKPAQSFRPEQISWAMVWFLSFASGLIMFALEIVWTHLLSAVIGLSVYSFANMLFAVFVGLYVAALREARPDYESQTSLAELVLWGSVLLALSVPFYAWTPLLFSAIGLFSPGFFVRQFALLAAACFLIVPVAMLLSRIFPRLLLVGVPPERKGRGVGFLLAVNTFGCLLGLFLGNFVLIPVLGAQITLKTLAALLGLIAWMVHRRSREAGTAATPRLRFGYALAFVVLLVLVVPWWPPTLLLSNRSTTFGPGSDGEFKPLYYLGEDAEGGFVTVSGLSSGAIELRTNGKYQGDNSSQMIDQYAFGFLPALAAHRTGNAFLIGCGTGVTARALADAGFSHVTLAELSKSILFAARKYFHKANGGILDDPRLTIIHDDGRNALALSSDRYDVISIELTSIWFAGAANLYSSDFYAMVHRKLVPGGVLQQWVQLHHMRLEDLYVLINTVHQNFKYVALWRGGYQGQLLASDQPLSLDWERMRWLAASRPEGGIIPTDQIYRMPFQVTLDQTQVEQFTDANTLRTILGHGIGQTKLPHALDKLYMSQFVDTDFFPYLEYATPRGNAIEFQEYLVPAFLAATTQRPAVVPLRNVPDTDLPLAKALLAYRNGDCDEVKRLISSGAVTLRADESTLFQGCTPNYGLQVIALQQNQTDAPHQETK